MSTDRNFDSISPSAKGLLLTKAMTTIPFAREAAALVWESDDLTGLLKEKATRESFGWLLHFENRYRTIDTLLAQTETTNVLEIASGFSFRGLQMCIDKAVVYIDTDLEASMLTKKDLVEKITARNNVHTKGKLLMQPLNALDEDEFNKVIDLFPPGPVTIVNEGLLMYLDEPEKRQLCANIRSVLTQRGGCWITGDVYLKKNKDQQEHRISEQVQAFLEYHKVEEKKFDSYESAAGFFAGCGFSIIQKETVTPDQLSALRYIKDRNLSEETIRSWFTNRQTWMLTPAS